MQNTAPFDAIAHNYDQQFTETAVGKLQRMLVRTRTEQFITKERGSALELNCGTGADALWLSSLGFQVLATDISEGMLAVTQAKIAQYQLQNSIQTTRVDAAKLAECLKSAGHIHTKFQLVFSNFGGINCLSPLELQRLATDLTQILPPKATLALVIMGRFCWWETAYFFLKGQFSKAFRRFSKQSISAPLDELITVETWYYSPREISNVFPQFRIAHTEAIGFWLPPSYLDPLMQRFPAVLPLLDQLEQLCRGRLFAQAADHYLLVMEKEA
jgi:hypothetical protein